MTHARLDQQISFILEIDRLKQIRRRNYLIDGSRHENTAEHSWHITLSAVVLYEHAHVDVDLLHVLKMLLVHDIVEIDADDTFAYDEVNKETQHEREAQAADRLFSLLPAEQAQELRGLWDEFEAQETAESQFALTCDRLMPLLHNFHTEGKAWQEHGVVAAQVRARAKTLYPGSEIVGEYATRLIDEAVKRGYLPEE